MAKELVFSANGKVLLSGEYLVMNGALALGLPISLGQKMMIKESSGSDIAWESFLPDGSLWFSAKFDLFGFESIKCTDEGIANTLSQIFESSVRLNSDFLSKWKKYRVQTHLDFDPGWGLGSSSTLISCISEWADVDPYDLLAATFGGSGYDIACAKSDSPIFYQLTGDAEAHVEEASFNPDFADQLYFVYLGKKQNTREALHNYAGIKPTSSHIDEISLISKSLCEVNQINDFSRLLDNHESLVSSILKQPRVQQERFSDYWGTVKSLGAWGGDFVMATSDRPGGETKEYFSAKGCSEIFAFSDLAIGKESLVTAS